MTVRLKGLPARGSPSRELLTASLYCPALSAEYLHAEVALLSRSPVGAGSAGHSCRPVRIPTSSALGDTPVWDNTMLWDNKHDEAGRD